MCEDFTEAGSHVPGNHTLSPFLNIITEELIYSCSSDNLQVVPSLLFTTKLGHVTWQAGCPSLLGSDNNLLQYSCTLLIDRLHYLLLVSNLKEQSSADLPIALISCLHDILSWWLFWSTCIRLLYCSYRAGKWEWQIDQLAATWNAAKRKCNVGSTSQIPWIS